MGGNGFGGSAWMYGAGISIAHSPNVEVYNNRVTDNFNGIAAEQSTVRTDTFPGSVDCVEEWFLHRATRAAQLEYTVQPCGAGFPSSETV